MANEVEEKDVVRETKERNILPCDMTKEEIAAENIVLLNTLQGLDDLEAERKALMADVKSRKEKLCQITEECRTKLRSRQIMRPIDCTLYLNFTQLTATTVRNDTCEQVQQRAMNKDERNMLNATPSLWPEEETEAEPLEPDDVTIDDNAGAETESSETESSDEEWGMPE